MQPLPRGRRALALVLASLAVSVVAQSCGARTGLPVPEPCEAIDLELERKIADLDMHIMLDSSGSMVDPAAGATTKWQATTTALQSFLQTPDADGLGVGITFFPVVDPNVPDQCGQNPSVCGDPDSCKQIGICLESETACQMDIGCVAPGFPEEPCVELGFCELAPDQACSQELGFPCAPGAGACIDYAFCDNHYTCDIGVYATPVVALQTLPEGSAAVVSAMQQREPEGATTTLPALIGVHQQATLGVSARPDRRQAVVLATDGLPTSCDASLESMSDDLAIEHLAEVAEAAAAAGVRTFVVGVFTELEAEQSQQNLDAIAKAGGTEAAFIVSAGLDLSDSFAQALEQARVVASTCEYPLPGGDDALELTLATITLEAPGRIDPLVLLDSASECSSGGSGVYAVADASGRRLVLCPSVCEESGDEGALIRVARSCGG
jgi:hypothetical protein